MEINVIRCILILLVILIHLTPFKESCPDAQNAILAFVVPLFLFITGYLFNVNKTWKQYAVYQRSLLTMYIIFESTYIVLSYFFPVKDGVCELNVSVVLDKLILNPIGPYWYLHTMIICGCIYYAMHRACKCLKMECAISVSVLIGVLLSYYSPLLGLMSPLAYFSGVIFRSSYCCPFRGSFVALITAIVTFIYGIVCNPHYATQLSYFSIVIGVCTIEYVIWCVRRLPLNVSRVIFFIGANTLPIYLFHPMFTLLSKMYFRSSVITGNLFFFCVLTVAIAAVGSLILGYIIDLTGISLLLFKKKMIRTI